MGFGQGKVMFRLDTRKAIEATAILLQHAAERKMGRKRLLALLYVADRESIKKTGRPINIKPINDIRHNHVYV